MQAAAEVQDTPLRLTFVAPIGMGVLWIVQLVPSQPSIRGVVVLVVPLVLTEIPTAVQAVGEVQDTALRLLLELPIGMGALWALQLVPSQRSIKGVVVVPLPSRELPTAVQAVGEVHDTPLRLLLLAPAGL
ncbi:MAG: hypothetical protein M3Z27_00200 [Actinomycetota bacterium]|nr:hypothetical protein [Actinomycetota bacterium]